MRALRKRSRQLNLAVWHTLLSLTIVAFLCRAVIPAGYMPDSSEEQKGIFAITLCVPQGGTSAMLMALIDDPAEPDPGDQVGNPECPFALLAAQHLLPTQAAPALAGAIAHRPLPLLHQNHSLPPLPAQGPPLGSRAPPSSLV